MNNFANERSVPLKRVAHALFLACAMTAIPLAAQTFTTLYSFSGPDGHAPDAGLVQATNGELYGTTGTGGSPTLCPGADCGTVFSITPNGALTTIFGFCNGDGCHSDFPAAALIQDSNGYLYGTTQLTGGGTVFRVSPGGAEAELHGFCDKCPGGSDPDQAALLLASNGDLYGTTPSGGIVNTECVKGCGTIFKLTPSGTFTTLYSFCSESECADGEGTYAGLIQVANGNFYGLAYSGGSNHGGTFFELSPSGQLTTLYAFCAQTGCADGHAPNSLIQGTDGNFYGTTYQGGNENGVCHSGGCGTVFKMTPAGALTTLYRFNGADGEEPMAGVIEGSDGNFYGTTSQGGTALSGSIFKLTPHGALANLYSFCTQTGCPDGELPYGALIQATNGDFYGTASTGGAGGDGTVFRLSTGLAPFVAARPAFGAAGTAVQILGNDLTSATGVTFGDTAALFHVVSNSEITVEVPAGASSGYIHVAAARGTLSSNAPFKVIP